MKRITLCADDYGIHPGVSEAISELAHQNRIQATSALVTSPFWRQDAKALESLKGIIDRGLHLNFTEGSGLTKPFSKGLPGLIPMLWRSHCHLLSSQIIEDEIRAQIDRYSDMTGTAPDFIDGHQHVHHLPQVRQALFNVLREKELSSLWIRSVVPLVSQVSLLKSLIISGSGARPLKQLIENSSLHTSIYTNAGFAGIYSLSEHEPFARLMSFWLEKLPDRGLIMCHPGIHQPTGLPSNTTPDHASARHNEFNFLCSDHFPETLNDLQISLIKLPPPATA